MADPQLSDDQLQELMKDQRFGPADMSLLTPSEQQRLKTLKAASSVRGITTDVAKGALKGAENTAIGFGDLVHKTPVLGDITDALAKLVGPAGTDPDSAFPAARDVFTTPDNTAQRVGKGLEQAAEFFLPGNVEAPEASMAIAKALGLPMPGIARSLSSPKLVNKAVALASHMAPALNAGGEAAVLAGAHGDESPGAEAMLGATGPLAGKALRTGFRATAESPVGREVLPIIASGFGVGALHNALGLGASLGMYATGKKLLGHAIEDPQLMKTLETLVQGMGTQGTRAGAAGVDAYRAMQRRLPAQVGQ